MTGRVTPPTNPDDLPSMRERNPGMWWVAVIVSVSMIGGAAAGLLAAIFL